MHIRNFPGSELHFLVDCRDTKEAGALIAMASTVDIDLGSCRISKPDCHTPPLSDQGGTVPAQPRTISEAVDDFIFRVLMGECTDEETRLLPTVLDRLYYDTPRPDTSGGAPR